MGRHAKSFNVVTDFLAATATLLLAYVRVVRNVSSGRHAWKPLPEVEAGASVDYAAVLHGWNADPATVRFAPVPVWPTVDPDRAERFEAVTT